MKLIERPDKEWIRKTLAEYDRSSRTPRENGLLMSDIYDYCCSYYEKELERIQKLLDGAADRERILNEITLIKNELIKLREERGGKEDLEGLAHEIWATAQCMPREGVEDAVTRIKAILEREEKK